MFLSLFFILTRTYDLLGNKVADSYSVIQTPLPKTDIYSGELLYTFFKLKIVIKYTKSIKGNKTRKEYF